MKVFALAAAVVLACRALTADAQVTLTYELNPAALHVAPTLWRWTGEGYLNDLIVTAGPGDLTVTYTHVVGGAWQSFLFIADSCTDAPVDIVLHLYQYPTEDGATIHAPWTVPDGKSLCYDSQGDRAYMHFFGEYR